MLFLSYATAAAVVVEDGLLNSQFIGDNEFLPLNSLIDEEVELEEQELPGNFAAGDVRCRMLKYSACSSWTFLFRACD